MHSAVIACGRTGLTIGTRPGMRSTTPSSPSAPPPRCTVADERAWVERMLPDYDNLRAAFEGATADQDIDLALRLVTSLPELAYLRVGYESAGWAERVVDLATPTTRCSPRPSVWPRGAPGIAASFSRARSLAALAQGGVPGRGTGRVAYPGRRTRRRCSV